MFFWKKFLLKYKRSKWCIQTGGKRIIVDSVILKTTVETYNRKRNPHCVLRGKGIIRYEHYKEGGYKKLRAIIE